MRGHIAYLISQYPACNHTFVLREVRQLRTMGWDIQTISIRPCDRSVAKLSREEAEEAERTLYVMGASPGQIVGAHLRIFFRRPLAYLATSIYALRTGHGGLRRLLYFAEAVIVGTWMEQRRLTHVHTHFSSTVALIMHRMFGVTFSATIHGSDEFIDPTGFCLSEKIAASTFTVGISNYGRSQLCVTARTSIGTNSKSAMLASTPMRFSLVCQAEYRSISLITVGRIAPVKGTMW